MNQLYIRFGDLPENGKSWDYARGIELEGISVYKAKDITDRILPTDTDKTAWEVDRVHSRGHATIDGALFDRPAYLVSGDRVGTGSDGETLIEHVEIVAQLCKPQHGNHLLQVPE